MLLIFQIVGWEITNPELPAACTASSLWNSLSSLSGNIYHVYKVWGFFESGGSSCLLQMHLASFLGLYLWKYMYVDK